MQTTFAKALEKHFNAQNNLTLTENGAVTNKSTNSKLLDFFSQAGALRLGRGAGNATDLFIDAFSEDKLLATKALFYFRDVRGGQGERETFRTFLRSLAIIDPIVVSKNLHLIKEYGRWDDYYALVDTTLEGEMFEFLFAQFKEDLQSEKSSLLGKWLKSENTSSPTSRELGKKTRKAFGLKPAIYRKALSVLRQKINVLETQLSKNKWNSIVYEHVPSQANLKYRKAFGRHDLVRYSSYLEAVSAGKAKINAKTQFPYEIVREAWRPYSAWTGMETERKALDVMWNNQPDYIGKPENSIVVCDVSGSMNGLPIQVSISLGIYVAERNTGPFHNKFMTFSERPQLQSIQGRDIVEKVANLSKAQWDMNTNVKAVFDTILSVGLKNKLSNEDIVKKIFIVSDMEFDDCTMKRANETLFQTIGREWSEAGYDLPLLVFWNVASRNEQSPMSLDDRGFVNVSGCSPSIFTNLMKCKMFDAYELMLDVLNGERYSAISV